MAEEEVKVAETDGVKIAEPEGVKIAEPEGVTIAEPEGVKIAEPEDGKTAEEDGKTAEEDGKTAEEAPASATKSKDSETLSQNSLVHLARGLGKESDGLTLPMLLNLPTTTIIHVIYEQNEHGLLYDDSYSVQVAVVEKCMLMWRHMTAEQKNKERIKTLEKAVREMGKNELADAIVERYGNHQEITPDIFA